MWQICLGASTRLAGQPARSAARCVRARESWRACSPHCVSLLSPPPRSPAASAPSAADAAPKKQKFEVTFEGDWGVHWYVRMDDERAPPRLPDRHRAPTAMSEFDAWTQEQAQGQGDALRGREEGRRLRPRPGRGRARAHSSTFGPGADQGCGDRVRRRGERASTATDGMPQWGRSRQPARVPGHRRRRRTRRRRGRPRSEEQELIDEVWDCARSGATTRARSAAQAKLSRRSSSRGKPQTVKGTTRQDFPGGGGHARAGGLPGVEADDPLRQAPAAQVTAAAPSGDLDRLARQANEALGFRVVQLANA